MSFYGGIKGKDFEIKAVYSSKAAIQTAITKNELDVNDYVMISTLNQGEEVTENSTVDNATLWKIVLNNSVIEPQFITKLAPSGVFSLGEVIVVNSSTENTLVSDIQNKIKELEIVETDFDIFPVAASASLGCYWYFTSSKQVLKIGVTNPIVVNDSTQASPNSVYSSEYLENDFIAPFARGLIQSGGEVINFSQIFANNIVKISAGGTGASNASDARANLEITPENIGALPLTGGTLTGPLNFSPTDNGRAVIYKNATTTNDNGIFIRDFVKDNNDESALLVLSKAKNQFAVSLDGKTTHKIYHEGNKPTPADIGATLIATGSYVGTGTTNIQNPVTLTFDFVPQFLVVGTPNPGNGDEAMMIVECNSGANIVKAFTTYTVNWVTRNEKTISWYHTNIAYADKAMNSSGVTYYYIAIG